MRNRAAASQAAQRKYKQCKTVERRGFPFSEVSSKGHAESDGAWPTQFPQAENLYLSGIGTGGLAAGLACRTKHVTHCHKMTCDLVSSFGGGRSTNCDSAEEFAPRYETHAHVKAFPAKTACEALCLLDSGKLARRVNGEGLPLGLSSSHGQIS